MKPCQKCSAPLENGTMHCDSCGIEQVEMEVKPVTVNPPPEKIPSRQQTAEALILVALHPMPWAFSAALCYMIAGPALAIVIGGIIAALQFVFFRF